MIQVHRGRLPLWLNPVFVTTTIIGVSIALFFAVPEEIFLSEFRQPRGSPVHVVQAYGFVWLTLTFGMLLPRWLLPAPALTVPAQLEQARATPMERPLSIMGWTAACLTLLGYTVYISTSGASIGIFLAALRGDEGANFTLRDAFEKTAGITSLMNLAPWWFVYIAFRRFVLNKHLLQAHIAITSLILILSLLRAFAVNERRVLFEIAIPVFVFLFTIRRNWPHVVQIFIRLTPILGLPVLMGVFLITEYFRTWVNFWVNVTNLSYFEWALTRLAGYYVTSLNNGITLMEQGYTSAGRMTFKGFFKMPILGKILALFLGEGEESESYVTLLEQFLNPEFNNQGGGIVPLLDYGMLMGGLCLLITGFAIGLAYRLALHGRLFSILMFSQLFLGLMEITRLWHFLSPIALINIMYVVIFCLLFRLRVRPVIMNVAPSGGRGA